MTITTPPVMGHRGAPSLAPENTLAGFQACFEAGATWTETDVCLLGDGTPVIFHDATLAAIAERNPASLDDLQGISGMGAKKLEAYGSEVLRVCAAAAQ